MALFQDSNFWVLLSFIIFIGVFLKYGRGAFLGMLDTKINTIKAELEQAESLRVEAQDLLAEYQRKHKDAMKEADSIIATAREHAEQIRIKAEEDAKRTAKRREEQLQLKLSRIEQTARQDIETYTAKLATDAAREILTKNVDSKTDKILISNTLASVANQAD